MPFFLCEARLAADPAYQKVNEIDKASEDQQAANRKACDDKFELSITLFIRWRKLILWEIRRWSVKH